MLQARREAKEQVRQQRLAAEEAERVLVSNTPSLDLRSCKPRTSLGHLEGFSLNTFDMLGLAACKMHRCSHV